MHHMELMTVVYGRDNLTKVLLGKGLGYSLLVLDDEVMHVVVAELETEKELSLGVNDLVETNDVRVLDQFHAANLKV